jgi:membrane protein DedA with SNARE-associated domain
MTAVNDWALALAGTPWVFLAVYAFATIDGFFPPIPSESLIIGLAIVFVQQPSPSFWLLGAAAAAGAFTGRRIPIRRLRFMQNARAEKAITWAEHALAHRGASFIIAARYVPVGRVAVNMTAGTTRFQRLRFSWLAAIAAISWSIYSVGLGVGVGVWLKDHPILSLVVGVGVGLLIGVIIDKVMVAVARRRGRGGGGADEPAEPAEPAGSGEPHEPDEVGAEAPAPAVPSTERQTARVSD